MPTILLDTDFLSSFLKIDRCDLIRSLYQVEQAFISADVHRELAATDLLTRLLSIPWIRVWSEESSSDELPPPEPAFGALGPGERSCILPARSIPDAILLMSDNTARRFAQAQGIEVANIPVFLLACKMVGLVDSEEMAQIIEDLRLKDFFEFRVEVRNHLLSRVRLT
jgi:predicted nucleic acid-binding protein